MLAQDVAPAGHVARAATAVGIGEREFTIAVYRPRVHPGALKFTIRNLGEDVHNLVVRRNGKRVGGLRTPVKPGDTATLRLTLRRIGWSARSPITRRAACARRCTSSAEGKPRIEGGASR